MWIVTFDNRKQALFKDINKALNSMAYEMTELKDKVLLDEHSNWASCSVAYTPLGDGQTEDWQKLDVFKKESVTFYCSINKSDVMEERGITEED